MKNKAAVLLGRMARGVKKTLTDEQREFRRRQLAKARLKRWTKKRKRASNA